MYFGGTNDCTMKWTRYKYTLAALFGFLLLNITTAFALHSAAPPPDDVVGVWKTGEGTAMVKIYKNGNKYDGKIVWLKEPIDPETKKPKLDKNNPDDKLKARPLLGLVNIFGFEPTAKNEWENGTVYDPKTGNEYKGNMKLKDANTLEVRGYIGVSLFGRTDVWKRQAAR